MSSPLSSTPPPGDLPRKPDVPPLVSRGFGEPRFHSEGDIASVCFANDDTIFSIDEAGVLRQWSVDGRLIKRTYLSDLETLWCFSPQATFLASGNDDLLFWDVKEGMLLRRIEQDSWITALAFSADGRTLASGHDDGKICFWDTAAYQLVGKIAAHPKSLSAISFSNDGRYLATSGEDRIVRVWDADTHKIVYELKSHTDRVPALAWTHDSQTLFSAGWDTSARVWKMGKTDPVILLNSHAEQVVTLAVSPNGKTLATADSDNDIYLWSDPETGTVGHVLRGHADEIRTLAFNAQGTKLASAGADRVVHIWDTQTGRLIAGPNPKGKHVIAVMTRGGAQILASAGGQIFRMWDTVTGSEVWPSGDGPAHSVATSQDGRWLAVGGVDHFTRLYDLNRPGSEPKKLEATKPPIGAIAISNKSGIVSHTSPADGLVWLWNAETGEPILILIEAADGCTLEGLALHPDGKRVIVGGIDYLSTSDRTGAVCVWDIPSKEKILTFDEGVYALSIDPSGRFLAGAGVNDVVLVWDLDTEELAFQLEGHQARINTVAFSPDGSYLISGSDDLTVRVWDVLSGRLIVTRELDSAILAACFSPDGHELFLGNGNTTCYQISFQSLLEE